MTRTEFEAACRARLLAMGWHETEPIPHGYTGEQATLWEAPGYCSGDPRRTLREAVCVQAHHDLERTRPHDERACP